MTSLRTHYRTSHPLRLAVRLAVFVASLFFPVVGTRIVDRPWLWVVLGAGVGALALWNLNVEYRRWIERPGDWTRARWLVVHLPAAAVGLLAMAGGAWSIRLASGANAARWVAVALGVVIAGLVVVVRVVHAELKAAIGPEPSPADPPTVDGAPVPVAPPAIDGDPVPVATPAVAGEEPPGLPGYLVWLLNGLLIVAATVVPVLILTTTDRGVSVRSLAVALVGAGLWALALWAGRREADAQRWIRVGFGLLVLPPVLVLVIDRNRPLPPWVFLAVGLVVAVAVVVLTAHQDDAPDLPFIGGEGPLRDVWLGLVGIGTAVVGGLLMLAVVGPSTGSPWPVLVAVAIPFVFGVCLVIRGEGLLLIALAGLGLVWAVTDHTDGPQTYASAGETRPVLLAFGDSYMSGEGIGHFYADTNDAAPTRYEPGTANDCRRSRHAYTPLLAERLDFGLWFGACSGAKALSGELAGRLLTTAEQDDRRVPDLDPGALAGYLDAAVDEGEAERNTIIGQLLRWWAGPEGERPEPRVVLLSMGGNDAGFSTIGTACLMPGSCTDALADLDLDVVANRVAVATSLIATSFPDAEIRVMAYPRMFGDVVDQPAGSELVGQCVGQTPFDRTDIRALSAIIGQLNDAVETGVNRANGRPDRAGPEVVFDDSLEHAFVGRRFCEFDDAGHLIDSDVVNTVYLQAVDADDFSLRLSPDKLIHNTFHPTEAGHARMADALCGSLADVRAGLQPPPDSPPDCPPDQRPDPAPGPGVEGSTPPAELAATVDKPPDRCTDLTAYVQCSLIDGAKRVAPSALALAVAGVALARLFDRNDVLRRAVYRLRRRQGRGGRLARAVAALVPIR